MKGAYTLYNVVSPKVEIVCDVCNRRGVYSTAKLFAQYGDEVALPDLRHKLVGDTCIHRSSIILGSCKVHYGPMTVIKD